MGSVQANVTVLPAIATMRKLDGATGPVLGVDGCVAWAASREPQFDGTAIRAVYDRHRRPPAGPSVLSSR